MLFEFSKLVRINEVFEYQLGLESFTNAFFYQFFQGIQKHNRVKELREVIRYLVRLKNNKTFNIFNNSFEMFS